MLRIVPSETAEQDAARADGVHFNIRLEEDRLCCLVLVGVRADGHTELVAVGDGFRESIESWSELLRDLKRRGMRTPVVAIGDGALGFRGALRDVFPEGREQRYWVPQDRQHPGCGAQQLATEGESCPAHHHERGEQVSGRPGHRPVRDNLRCEVSKGGRQATERPRGAAHPL
jgi:hypothetical protein